MRSLDKMDLLRYKRQFILDEIGVEGQKKLKNSSILCIGAGGLGSPLLLYLTAAGVGTLGIVDDDIVDLTNLQRQTLYSTEDINKKKVEVAKEKLIHINPSVSINIYNEKLTVDNALSIISHYDYVADCTDNYNTRYIINDACFHLKKPFVHAGIYQFEGYCTLFAVNQQGPCYRCLFPSPPSNELLPNCSESGVLGVLPGIIGCIQASELIKYILNLGESLIGKLFVFDTLSMETSKLQILPRNDCVLCKRNISYFDLPRFSPVSCHVSEKIVTPITSKQLYDILNNEKELFLLDVREPHEYEDFNLGGYLIPLGELSNRIGQLDAKKEIVVYCKSGRRSEMAAIYLKEHGFQHIMNLQGGILSWLEDIGTQVPKAYK